MTVIHILVALFSFGFIIFFHELFHYLAARAVGIKPKEFAIGFGKSLIVYQKKKFYFLPHKDSEKYDLNEISYHLKLLPLGGYVLFERPVKNAAGKYEIKGEYQKIHPLKRIFIAVAGPIGNFILAFILMLSLFSPYMAFNPDGKIINVQENSIASSIGLKETDRILKFNDKPIESLNVISEYVTSQDKLCITWENNNGIQNDCVNNDGDKIGVTFSMSIWQGIIFTGEGFIDLLKMYTSSFFEVILNLDIKEFNGPIGTVDAIQQTVPFYDQFLSILVLVNIALGAANLMLPLSVTDGGKIITDIICLIRRKKALDTKYLDTISVILMIALFVTTFFLDISRIAERLF